ncbi:thiamine pyrophosphate-requiring protein [Marinicaulis aureus]|uniref:Thiamine pyrophosphate-requiring protein n=1 Tax=Hyphococcus aureus TaxID=2666033 RepID=A0ABW1KYM0_9PROT
MYSASMALLTALEEAGVEFIFANFGSDHAGLLEAIAEARRQNINLPRIITSPHEAVALSAAHGHAMVSGKAQAVFVHVDCGTQSLAGGMHNADRGRTPVFIFAGLSPFTQDGELPGSRNEFIQWIQDAHDQTGIVRGSVRYANEVRTGRNIKQITNRALQFAQSDPQGPVYVTAAREVLEETVPPCSVVAEKWRSVSNAALHGDDARLLAEKLAGARRPLIVTSYLGRKPEAVAALEALSETLGAGVLESVPSRMNFPHDNPLYQGNQWNEPQQNDALAEADVVLAIDTDVPWIAAHNRPGDEAAVFHIDIDPLKQQMPLWHIGSLRSFRADAAVALEQITASLRELTLDDALIAERRNYFETRHHKRAAALRAAEQPAEGVTAAHFVSRLRRHASDNTIVLNESITEYKTICDHMMMTRPGSAFTSGGGSLGWNTGAALGAKLAAPDSEIITIGGDGSYMFSIPSTAHWMARRYKLPFLQIVLNNNGWNAPRHSMLSVHPSGEGSRADDLDISFAPAPDYGAVAAAAGGAFTRQVRENAEIDDALEEAYAAIRKEGRCAVLGVQLQPR